MRVVVIGGTGHIGTYLIPRLVALGHEVICVTRGQSDPYHTDAAWSVVRKVAIDREAADKVGSFGAQIAALEAEVVIDLICFDQRSAAQLVEALDGRIRQLLHCGTIWVHGPSVEVPVDETQPRRPFGQYGINKAEAEAWLLEQAAETGFPVSILHPGHIVGPGWIPLNPVGNYNFDVFTSMARGELLRLPNLGLETVHHVHADDVAQLFQCALERPAQANGQSFHAVSPRAISLRGFAERVFEYFGQEPKLEFMPWEAWRATVSELEGAQTWDHIAHSPSCSIEKGRRMLGYAPRYSSLEAVFEALDWYRRAGAF